MKNGRLPQGHDVDAAIKQLDKEESKSEIIHFTFFLQLPYPFQNIFKKNLTNGLHTYEIDKLVWTKITVYMY